MSTSTIDQSVQTTQIDDNSPNNCEHCLAQFIRLSRLLSTQFATYLYKLCRNNPDITPDVVCDYIREYLPEALELYKQRDSELPKSAIKFMAHTRCVVNAAEFDAQWSRMSGDRCDKVITGELKLANKAVKALLSE